MANIKFERRHAPRKHDLVRFVGRWSHAHRATINEAVKELEAHRRSAEARPHYRPVWKVTAHDTPMSGRFYTARRRSDQQEPALSAPSIDKLLRKMKAAYGG